MQDIGRKINRLCDELSTSHETRYSVGKSSMFVIGIKGPIEDSQPKTNGMRSTQTLKKNYSINMKTCTEIKELLSLGV